MAHTPPTPAQITNEIFHLLDANGDKSITLAEIEGAIKAHDHGHTPNFARLENLFDHLDANHSGGLSNGEVNTAVTRLLTLVHDHAPELHPPHNVHDLLALLGQAAHHDWVV
jgi:Ca2+-binding EF-hand superfamily protein